MKRLNILMIRRARILRMRSLSILLLLLLTATAVCAPSSEETEPQQEDQLFLDTMEVNAAKGTLTAAINAGKALTSFVGHSSASNWTHAGLFSGTEVKALTNSGAPTVVTQWGCWNSYYVRPDYNTMAHAFLVSGDTGAAAVMGATALTLASSEQTLGEHMMPRLAAPGMTLGQAMLEAKQQAAAGSGDQLKDVLYGWTLLGDPTLVIDP